MAIQPSEVEKIAHLAGLAVGKDDIAQYTEELSHILSLVDKMNAVDTEGVLPMAHPLDMVARLRPDEVTEPDQRELFQSIAPEVAGGLYIVPKVIE